MLPPGSDTGILSLSTTTKQLIRTHIIEVILNIWLPKKQIRIYLLISADLMTFFVMGLSGDIRTPLAAET